MKKAIDQQIIDALQFSEIEYLITVPTSRMEKVYQAFEKNNKCIYVTREEEGAALASGLALGNKKGLLFIQQTGVGNMLNCLFSFAEVYDIYFPILVMDRGEEDMNPVHHNSSRKTYQIIKNEGAISINWNYKDAPQQLKECIEQKTRWIYCNY